MKVRVLSMLLGLWMLQWAGPMQAQKKDLKSDEIRLNAVEAEAQLSRQFTDFVKQLQTLKNRLDRSDDQGDKDRAAQLQKVLDTAETLEIRTKFTRLQEHLKKPGQFGTDEYKEAARQTEDLAKDFNQLLTLFEGRDSRLADQVKDTRDKIKLVEELIKEQKRVQLMTEQDKTAKKELVKLQGDVSKDTKDVGAQMDGKDPKKEAKTPPPGEAKDAKSEPKEGKGDQKSESRDAGKQKQGEAKDKGQNKDGKENKPGETKGGEKKGGEKKPANPDTKNNENKAGEKKDKGAESKNKAESKSGSKDGKDPKGGEPKEAKGSEKQQGESKDAAGKKDGAAEPKAKEAGEAKGKQDPKNETKDPKNETKPGEPKAKEKGEENKAGAKDAKGTPPDAKQADPKDAGKDSKQAEAKAGDPKAGQKSTAKNAPPMQGQPKEGDQQPQTKGDKDKGAQPPPPPPQDKEQSAMRKKIQDAIDKMEQAKKKIEDDNKDGAADDQDKAIRDLEQVKKELEKRLQILREEELERLLANLKTRCERMLAMQLDVLNHPTEGTVATFNIVQRNSDKKPTDAQAQMALRLASKEDKIVLEATQALELLASEGTATAFPEAFKQVREDMKHVMRRLDPRLVREGSKDEPDVGLITQQIERDIIVSLEDMIKVLTKKQEEMKNKKEKDKNKPPQSDKDPGPQPDPKLLNQIEELKMILALQLRLNDRTKLYSSRFPGQEQPSDPNVIREIGELRERQERIYNITNQIQKGDNK